MYASDLRGPGLRHLLSWQATPEKTLYSQQDRKGVTFKGHNSPLSPSTLESFDLQIATAHGPIFQEVSLQSFQFHDSLLSLVPFATDLN